MTARVDGDFDDENAGNGRYKIAKGAKKTAGSQKIGIEKDENDEEEIHRKQELKLANEKVLRSGVREAPRCYGEMGRFASRIMETARVECLAGNVCSWFVQIASLFARNNH